jgi:hypothetical protein
MCARDRPSADRRGRAGRGGGPWTPYAQIARRTAVRSEGGERIGFPRKPLVPGGASRVARLKRRASEGSLDVPSYTVLKSVAHNLGHSFLNDMNTVDGFKSWVPQTLLELTISSGEATVHIDLLARTIAPSTFQTPDTSKSVNMYGDMLADLITRQGAVETVVEAADLRLAFDLQRSSDPARPGPRPVSLCRAHPG